MLQLLNSYLIIILVYFSTIPCFYANDFIKYTTINGLSSDIVDAITQDEDGYIYIGTPIGLNVFNGNSFKVFNTLNTPNFSNQIKCILPINNEIIIVGSIDNGLYIFNKLYGSIIPFQIKEYDKTIQLEITALLEDKYGSIWVGTKNYGLLKITSEKLKFSINQSKVGLDINQIKTKLYKPVKCIYANENNLWVGTQNDGLYKHKIRSSKPDFIAINTHNNEIWDIEFSKGKLYVAQFGGLEIINLRTDKRTLLLQASENLKNVKNTITSITKDDYNRLWVGTLNNGLYSISIDNNSILEHFVNNVTDARTININKIISVFYDSNHNLWIGTWHGGINKLSLKSLGYKNFKFKDKADDLSQNIVWRILPINKGKILLGTNGNGLCELNRKNEYFEKSELINHIKYASSLFLDKKEQILWIGTWENGLIKYNLRSNSYKTYLNPNQLQLRIQKVSMDKNGVLWIGTNLNGLYSLNTTLSGAKPKRHFLQLDSLKVLNDKSISVNALEVDSDNTIWIGGFNHGLFKINSDFRGNIISSYYIDIENRLSKEYKKIRDLFIDSNKNIWVGFENGVVVYNSTKDSLNELAIFKNLTINDFLEDKNKNIWIATHDGLYKYDLHKKVAHYFSGIVGESIIEDQVEENIFWLSSNHGVYKFNPLDFDLENDIPKLVISSYIEDQNSEITPNVNNLKRLNYQDHLTQKYKNNSLNLKVSTLFFEELHDIEIQYKLENYDEEWNRRLGNETILTYKNIPPGEYELLIKAYKQNSIENYSLKTLGLTILPPWWQHIYAKIIYILLLVSLFLFSRYTIRNRNLIKINRIQAEKDKELNDLKLNFFTNISHDFRTPLTLISGPIDNLLTKDVEGSWQYKQHKLIQKNTSLLLKLVNQILDFRKLESSNPVLEASNTSLKKLIKLCINQFENMLKESKIKIVLKYDSPHKILWIDAEKMEKVFINLFSNAIKYSDHKKNIYVTVNSSSKNIKISIVNYGIGIPNNELKNLFDRFYQSGNHKGGSGIGLSIVKSLVELHKGTVKATSDRNNKTIFTIKLPLNVVLGSQKEIIENKKQPLLNNFKLIDNADSPNENTSKDTVLIIEDNNELRNYIKEILEAEYQVIDVNNGKWGIEKAETLIPQLIISDIMMDGIDGIEVCRILKSNIDTSHIPIILLTAKDTDEARIDGYNKGADDYITKPFNTRILKTRINNLLEQRKRLKEKSNLLNIEPRSISPTSVDEKFLQKTMKILDDKMSNHLLSVEDVANELNLNHNQFYRKIKNLTGHSASKFIQMVRLKRAAQLLKTEKYKVSEILYEVGFTSPSYFTKCFKKEFGKSPSEYVKNKND